MNSPVTYLFEGKICIKICTKLLLIKTLMPILISSTPDKLNDDFGVGVGWSYCTYIWGLDYMPTFYSHLKKRRQADICARDIRAPTVARRHKRASIKITIYVNFP
jgi:hypothetical protein